MRVDFEAYEPYRPPVVGPTREMPRREARTCYNDFLASRFERVEQLRGLLARNGITLSDSDESIHELNRWYIENVALAEPGNEWLANVWYAVTHDVGIFLAEVALSRSPGLHWELRTFGKRNLHYQRPVLMGFTRSGLDKYTVDFVHLVSVAGHRAAKRMSVSETEFAVILHSVASKA